MNGWAWTALALHLGWAGTAFGVRAALQRRRTGDAGFRGISGRPGDASWWAGVLFVIALLGGAAAPAAALAGLPTAAVPAARWTGLAVALAGMAATLAAQTNMGASWRVGVDEGERTALVTGGLFAHVRNPVFTTMAATAAGLVLMVPNGVSLLALVCLVAALQLQVRVVEEPYLRAVHGPAYAAYAARTGRFLPRVGRLAS
ncbi:methyltransferase family protein [Streptomyces sudanensis]|uniref:Isoprenylcysteine carboxylmethyltransferase family protein n=2 Tax=Streptomyces TaxID=1883 RepID=A0ABY4TC44_9ACTN|nr:isoprenylcysteine carboxylmethyltransferase family protein [Streptomyces sudanensis]MCP9958545.1 isoprenylcysteine carboxylmethyltransferase family protein [Streptomyces sudanensis]MCP9987662.1 isoprenylcysteine carboxylmethyltransferase family protein [Streptomyces sudanensis]MCQ0000945.1 isoprenylcysteine carboxylmethyltransferase family protein [Streptomyces sudanensis]URN16530.1 isoprenylcysteine carboxylmethyltransferase family protein [Streptomyces sudanensis]